MRHIEPFKIEIPQSVLDDLSIRLKNNRWTDEPQNAGWSYGTNPTYLRELVDYWQNRYDWRKNEAELNKFNHFKVNIDGVMIHFIYEKGKNSNSAPLLLTHGWPDSFYRYYKVIPKLTGNGDNTERAFDVVIPSMPGFGFSDRVAMPSDKVADLWAKLMTDVLGYKSFYAAGGDLGTPITKSLAIKYPDTVKGIHLTDVGYPTGMEDMSSFTQAEKEFAQITQRWWFMEGAYNALQSTKPQTLGYGLNDSPVGLASWMVEKFNTWSDNKGNIENSFTKDELLTNIMIYWVTQTINSSIRTYAENMRAMFMNHGRPSIQRVEVPTAVAVFPGDTAPLPREWAERMVNVQRYTKMPEGGHFAALEAPELYTKDLYDFIESLIEAQNVKPISDMVNKE
jgi:pimeloyl-ACP methyl ester carboxylesterase